MYVVAKKVCLILNCIIEIAYHMCVIIYRMESTRGTF